MTDTIKLEDIEDTTSVSTVEEDTVEETDEETTDQDPLIEELEKVQKKEGKTEIEKAAYTLKKNADRVKELGGDPNAILGMTKEEQDDEDDKPFTVGMFKQMQQKNASKDAFTLADDIENTTERELVKYHLENTIKSTGNADEDLDLARSIVNAKKNKQIITEITRKTAPKTHSSGTSVPPKKEDTADELTVEEQKFMRPPFSLSKEAILKSRPKR